MDFNTWDVMLWALSGGLAATFGSKLGLKIIDIAHGEFQRWFEQKKTAKAIVDKQLDPILKAADELFGKLLSLAEGDFKNLKDLMSEKDRSSRSFEEHLEIGSILYLFAQFWARIEILRQESVYVSLSRNETGKMLLDFIHSFEARRTRLVKRSLQRAIGEKMIVIRDDHRECLPLAEMVEKYISDVQEAQPSLRIWLDVLEEMIGEASWGGKARQRILVYGVIVQALLDTLDEDRKITKNRPAYPNKLTRGTRRDLQYRVFGKYLSFVKNPEKYFLIAPKN